MKRRGNNIRFAKPSNTLLTPLKNANSWTIVASLHISRTSKFCRRFPGLELRMWQVTQQKHNDKESSMLPPAPAQSAIILALVMVQIIPRLPQPDDTISSNRLTHLSKR